MNADKIANGLTAAQPPSASGSCTAWPSGRSARATRAMPASTAVATTAPAGMFTGQWSPQRARSSR